MALIHDYVSNFFLPGSESKQRLETKVPIQMEKKKTLSVHKMSRRERNSHGRERLLKEGQYGHYEHTRASSSLSSLCLDPHIQRIIITQS